MGAEKFTFQAESKQLLNLMVHSIYSNKEIFLRELISNASDAIDRLRFESITRPELLIPGEKFEIRLDTDPKGRTLTVIDNGIGMDHEDLIKHIGTIARSGTQEFIKNLKEKKTDSSINDMIGQFGVGFYSAFMAADFVTIDTKKAGEEAAYRWESNGEGEYTLSESDKKDHGSVITLHLKPVDKENGIDDFTDYYTISNIVKRYSDFINYPIVMKREHEQTQKDKKDGKKSIVTEDTVLNSMKPIWLRPSSEVTKEEYNEFYRHISHDWSEVLKTIYFKAEWTVEFHSLLFIPSKAPFNLFYQGYKSGLQLYVKKVLIMEAFEDLLPKYLRFIKGVVESSDLPLNISREMLQQDRNVSQIKKSLTKKVIDSLLELYSNENENYKKFFKEFGNALKEGIISDFENKEKIAPLILFESSHSNKELTNLDEYIGRMKEGQNHIYTLTAESRNIAENSPHLEALKQKDYEVIFLLNPVDEIMTGSLNEYKGKKIKSIEKGDIDLDSPDEKKKNETETKAKQEEFSVLLKYLGEKLDKYVKEARVSIRLVNSPACITGDEFDVSPYLEKMMRKDSEESAPVKKRIMEINPNHPLIHKFSERLEKDAKDPVLEDYAELLLGYALLAEGAELPDPVKFNRLVISLMEKSL
ncbi:MAG: molecular chaperone HtpG [Brevinematales bacterium]